MSTNESRFQGRAAVGYPVGHVSETQGGAAPPETAAGVLGLLPVVDFSAV